MVWCGVEWFGVVGTDGRCGVWCVEYLVRSHIFAPIFHLWSHLCPQISDLPHQNPAFAVPLLVSVATNRASLVVTMRARVIRVCVLCACMYVMYDM